MAELGLALYVTVVTVLFFFWAYGIYAFVRDLRDRWLPKARQYRRGRRRQKRQREAEHERSEKEEQLY